MKNGDVLRAFAASVLAIRSTFAGCTVSNIICYEDMPDHRILPQMVRNGALTQAYCAQLCADAKYTLAGVEWGSQCYCGDSLTTSPRLKPASDCNMPCTANTTQMCGSDDRMGVFKVVCSGPPEPAPPSPGPTPPPPPTPEVPQLVNPCLDPSFSALPFCDHTLPIAARVEDIIKRMSLSEKISNLGSVAGPVKAAGLPEYNWWSEATHGISQVRHDAKTPYATNFACPITTAASFNRTLWARTGAAIGTEARAYMNVGNGYSTFWAPVVNLAREPRWGRNIETPGEDPYLTGQYAIHFVTGLQEAPELDTTHLQASACCKHYVANEMDQTTQNGVHHWRSEFDARVSVQDLVDSYMPPFQAYNEVNGELAPGEHTVAQIDYDFNHTRFAGYVTADCDADADVYFNHHYTKTPEEAVRDVLKAGTDIDCANPGGPGFVGTYAKSALDKGLINEADIDERLRKSFTVRMRLSHFDPIGPLNKIPLTEVCSAATRDVAQEGSRQGAVLIRNELDSMAHSASTPTQKQKQKQKQLQHNRKNTRTLPLDATVISSVALIGPNVHLSESVAGYYGGNSCNNTFSGGRFPSMVDAVKQYVANVSVLKGVASPQDENVNTTDIAAAAVLAASVDRVILVVGTDLDWAREGHDATSLQFSNGTLALTAAVSKAASRPVVVVVMTATPLDLTPLLTNERIGAILHAGMPSVATLGVGDVLFGLSPAGRTVQTVYPAAYADSISIFDMAMRPGPSDWPAPNCTAQPQSRCPNATNPGRTYRFYHGDAVVPFGFGLSYSSFSYSLGELNNTARPSPAPAALPPTAMTVSIAGDVSVMLGPAQQLVNELVSTDRTFFAQDSVTRLNTALHAQFRAVNYSLTITNTGGIDADDAVLGFLVPPNAGVDGAPLKTLFAFERVHLKAGESKTVFLYPSVVDFTQVDVQGRRVVQGGEYTVQFGEARSGALGQGYLEHRLSAELI